MINCNKNYTTRDGFAVRIVATDAKGHEFKVVKVENSTDYLIIRDGRQTRRVKQEIAEKAIENVDKLFKD